jgi:hypothetical protein
MREHPATPRNTRDDDAHPIMMIDYFIRFDTDQRIGAHPFDLLTERGKTVEISLTLLPSGHERSATALIAALL